MTFDKSKLTFRVKAPKSSIVQGVLNGWQQVHLYGMGVMHDTKDPSLISICFFDEPDSYCTFENVELEEYKQRVREAINKCKHFKKDVSMSRDINSKELIKELGLEY